jgi:O-antigen/teichoic acid export membrane protein
MNLLTPDRAIRSTLVVFAGQVAARILDLLAVLYIARTVSEAEFGRFSFVFAYLGYFAIVADCGFNLLFVRELVRQPDRASRLLKGTLVIKTALIALSMIMAGALILIPDYPQETVHLVWMTVALIAISPRFPSFRLVHEQIFQAALRMTAPVLIRLLDGALLVFLLCLMAPDASLETLIIPFVVAYLPGLALIIWSGRRLAVPAGPVDWPAMMDLLRQGVPITLLGVFAVMTSRFDVFLLSLWRGEAEIGLYSAAYRLTEALRMIPGAALLALYPLITQTAEQPFEKLRPILNQSLKALLILLIPVCAGVFFLSDRLILLFYTDRYREAVPSLEVIVWAELPVLISALFTHTLIAIRRQSAVAWIAGLIMGFNALLNMMLIPEQGYIGASVARGLSEAVGMTAYGFVLHRLTGWSGVRTCLSLLPATGAVMAWLWWFASYPLAFILISSAALYAAALRLTGAMTDQDIRMVRNALFSGRNRA